MSDSKSSNPSSSEVADVVFDKKYPYAILGGTVLAAMASIIALATLGVSGPGFFSFTYAATFWAMGSALLVLTAACTFLFFTLRATSRVLAKHEAQLRAAREHAQDGRLDSLESSRRAGNDTANHDGRLTSLENSRHGSSAGAVAQDARLVSLEDASVGAGRDASGMSAEITRLESRIASLENPRSAMSPNGASRMISVSKPAAARAEVFGDVHAVIDVEGIGPVYADVLNAHGIYNTRQLWEADASAIATSAKVPLVTAQKWQQMSELIAIKGIGPQYAELLVRAGVTTIPQLRDAESKDLLARVTRAQPAGAPRIQGNVIAATRVESWIRAAQEHVAVPTVRAFSGLAPVT